MSIKDGGNLKKDPQNLGVFAPTAAGTSAADLNYAMWKRYGSRYRILVSAPNKCLIKGQQATSSLQLLCLLPLDAAHHPTC